MLEKAFLKSLPIIVIMGLALLIYHCIDLKIPTQEELRTQLNECLDTGHNAIVSYDSGELKSVVCDMEG